MRAGGSSNKTVFHGLREIDYGDTSKMSENKKQTLNFKNCQVNNNLILNKDFLK